MKDWPGVFEAAGKLWGRCGMCEQIIRVDKPIFGSLHICLSPEEAAQKMKMIDGSFERELRAAVARNPPIEW